MVLYFFKTGYIYQWILILKISYTVPCMDVSIILCCISSKHFGVLKPSVNSVSYAVY